ncbi:MAG: hypothetical protein J6D11_02860 [Clostridia bacterium]|nr:hypothetical protein [Clostridia bacterium]
MKEKKKPRKHLDFSYVKLYRKIKRLVRVDVRPHEMRDEAMEKLYEMLLEAQGNGVSVQALLPQGFDVFYSEFVAELPAFTHEERLQRRSVTHFLYCACIAFLAVLVLFAYTPTDEYISYLKRGFPYIVGNDDYILNTYESDVKIEFEVDLTNFEENIGKCVYEDEDCKIVIDYINVVTKDTVMNGGYIDGMIQFRAYPKYSFNYARTVTGLAHSGDGYPNIAANMVINAESGDYRCPVWGASMNKQSDAFGFHFFGAEFEEGTNFSKEDWTNTYKFTLSGLVECVWERK